MFVWCFDEVFFPWSVIWNFLSSWFLTNPISFPWFSNFYFSCVHSRISCSGIFIEFQKLIVGACVRACVCNCSCVCVWVDVNLKFFRLNNYIFPHYFQYYNFTLKHNNQNLIFQYFDWINDIFDLNNFEIRLLSE